MKNGLLLAAAVFATLLIRPLLIGHLRAEQARKDPAGWSANPMNGPYAVLLPQLLGTRYFDEATYAARVHQVVLHGVPYTPYWRDFRRPKHWLYEFIPPYLMASFVWICGGNINAGWTLAVAAVGAGWAMLWFLLLRAWCSRDETAAPLALLMSLFPDIGFWLLDASLNARVFWDRWSTVFFHRGSMILPHSHRLYSQHLSFFLVCLLLTALWRLASAERTRMASSMLAGCGLASMVFVHPYEYAFVMGIAALLPIGAEAAGAPAPGKRNLWTCLATALVGAAGYLALQHASHEPGELSALIVGVATATRRFHPATMLHLALSWWIWTRIRQESSPPRKAAWLLLGSAQLAAFLWRNAELLIGRDIQFFHFLPMAGTLGAAAILLAVSDRLTRSPRWTPRAAAGIAAAVLSLALVREISAARATYRFLGLPADAARAYGWLSRHAPKDSLLLSPSIIVNLSAPIYSPMKVEAPPIQLIEVLFSRDYYNSRVARMLKTIHVDPDRFIADRWPPPDRRIRLETMAEHAVSTEGRIAVDALESSLWFRGYFDLDASTDSAEKARLIRRCREASPLPGPFYIWVDEADRPLFREPPEKWAGPPIFVSGRVSLYLVP